MAAHRYWRADAFEPYALAELELSAFYLLNTAGERVDAGATIYASVAQSGGVLESLQDQNLSTFTIWHAEHVRNLNLTWDFGALPVDVTGIRLAGNNASKFPLVTSLSYSDNGQTWVKYSTFAGIAWPGVNELTRPEDVYGAKAVFTPGLDAVVSAAGSVVQFSGPGKWNHAYVSRPIHSGQKVYFEAQVVTDGFLMVGTATINEPVNTGNGGDITKSQYFFNGQKRKNNIYEDYGQGYTVNDFVGVSVDFSGPSLVKISGFKNGVSQGPMYEFAQVQPLVAFFSGFSNTGSVRFTDEVPASRTPSGFSVIKGQRLFRADSISLNEVAGRATLRNSVVVGSGAVLTYGNAQAAAVTRLSVEAGCVKDYNTGILGAGKGRVSGTVKKTGLPNEPVYRKVRLIRERDGLVIRESWSDATTGDYKFEYIDEMQTWTVVSYDYLKNYRAVIADGILPEMMT